MAWDFLLSWFRGALFPLFPRGAGDFWRTVDNNVAVFCNEL